jgi:hypothetical protein
MKFLFLLAWLVATVGVVCCVIQVDDPIRHHIPTLAEQCRQTIECGK